MTSNINSSEFDIPKPPSRFSETEVLAYYIGISAMGVLVAQQMSKLYQEGTLGELASKKIAENLNELASKLEDINTKVRNH